LGLLAGSWVGAGLHVGYWSDELATRPQDLAASATRETVSFAQSSIRSGASDEPELSLPGVYFLRRSNERESGRPVHAESGTWLAGAEPDGEPDPFEILCVTRSARGAQSVTIGAAHVLIGPAATSPITLTPSGATFAGRPANVAHLTPPPGVSRAEVENPHLLLRRAAAELAFERTVWLSVTSAAADALARALRRSGLALEPGDRPRLELDMWLGSGRSGEQLLLSRRFARERDGVAWPQISVATLTRSDACGR